MPCRRSVVLQLLSISATLLHILTHCNDPYQVAKFLYFSDCYFSNILQAIHIQPIISWLTLNGTHQNTAVKYHLNQNSQAVKKKKSVAPKKVRMKKRCEIQGGGQEMAVMVG